MELSTHGELGVGLSQADGDDGTRARMRRIERQEWWLWAVAATITLLLTGGILSFLPLFSRSGELSEVSPTLTNAMWGLAGLVLLFDLHTVYQQLQIHRIRRHLFETEQLFRLISENAADLIAVVDVDGNYIHNSLSYQKGLGYQPDELRNSSAFDRIHPDDVENVREAWAETRRTSTGKTLEHRIRHKGGAWRVLESTTSVIRRPGGEPDRLVIVNRDITERKQAAETQRLSEAAFRSMVEDAPYGIARADFEGTLIRANPALQRMLGYSRLDDLLNIKLGQQVFVDSAEFLKLKGRLETANEFKDVELELRRGDGSPITVRCSGRCVKQDHGDVACFDLFVEDITEKRILERQLQMAGKMEAIGRLSGGIAHDFNNLLGVIIGYSQLVKRNLGPKNDLMEHVQEIEKAGQRAASLTRQLLAFSRQQVMTPAVLNLNDLVADMVKMLPRILGEDVTVSTSLSPDLAMVKADQSQIEQVILNLAVNARDAMPNGGKLRIETTNVELDRAYTWHHPGARVGSYVRLAVADSGMGISPDALPHIFEPFFTTKEVGKGTGLGLATVYGIVKQSDGYIWVDSELGNGACFQVFLPQVSDVATAVAAPPSEGKLQGSETILLVEDSDALRKLTHAFLEAHGFRVLTAGNAEEALQVDARHAGRIQLLLTDVIMPGINGRALAERLSPRHPEMRVLYMSGYTDSSIATHGVLERGKVLLNKPFTEEVLIKKVREVLDTSCAGST